VPPYTNKAAGYEDFKQSDNDNAVREATVLRAALDRIDYGIALLDYDLRAQFLNRAFRIMWSIPNEKAANKPTFVDLMHHGRDIGAYAIAPDELETFVAGRLALVRSGDEEPIDLRLIDGKVIRFQCKVLPDGGRMLTYVDVTDLVRSADQFKEQATTDSMTGLFNRRHFLAVADSSWNRFHRYGRPLSLLMLDIDHFKSINDRFGHDVGDRVIVQIAEVCRESNRSSDVIARFGGEEFMILLPETGLQEAIIVAERVRQMVSERSLQVYGGVVHATVSVGVAQADDETPTLADLLKRADQLLYKAKRDGRNCVVAGSAPNLQSSTSNHPAAV
jgi:diguanylate cyclase (GGDEF)-like protein